MTRHGIGSAFHCDGAASDDEGPLCEHCGCDLDEGRTPLDAWCNAVLMETAAFERGLRPGQTRPERCCIACCAEGRGPYVCDECAYDVQQLRERLRAPLVAKRSDCVLPPDRNTSAGGADPSPGPSSANDTGAAA